MLDDLIAQDLDLPGGPLTLLQPREVAELPDEGEVQWAPLAPYWAVLWRSGVALAEELDRADLRGTAWSSSAAVSALPSLAAARAGADVLATDIDDRGAELLERNAQANGLAVETAAVDWARAGAADPAGAIRPRDRLRPPLRGHGRRPSARVDAAARTAGVARRPGATNGGRPPRPPRSPDRDRARDARRRAPLPVERSPASSVCRPEV